MWSFASLVRKLQSRWSKGTLPLPVRGSRRDRRNSVRLAVEPLEDRTVLATLPLPTVPGQVLLPFFGNPPITSNNNTPSIVVDPTNSQRLVAVYNAWVTAGTQGVPFSTVIVATSTDGGTTWPGAQAFLLPGAVVDPASAATPQAPFVNQFEPTLAMGRSGSFYITCVEQNGLTPANRATGGALVLRKFTFGSTTPSLSRTLYQWVNDDPVFNPVVVVDTTLGPNQDDPSHPGERVSFVDPETGATQVNLLGNSGGAGTDRVYVAWNSNNTAPPNAQNFNPNVIKMVASVDGGSTFSTQMYVSDGGNAGTARHAFPSLAVAQGSPSDGINAVPGPQIGVTSLSRVGPNVLVNAPGHGFQNGDEVRILGSRLPLGLTVASLTQTGGTATLTTTGPHGLTSGTRVVISGANEAEYNSTFIISFNSANSFTFSIDPNAPATATGAINLEGTYDGRFIVSRVSGNQFAYSIGGGLTGTDNTGGITAQATNVAVQGGTVAVGWNNFGAPVNNRTRILADSFDDGGVGVVITGTGGLMADGINPGADPHIAVPTNYTLNVTPGQFANGFRTIADLDVNVALVHPHLNQVTLQLISPDGTTFTLIRPSTNGSAQAINPAQGLTDNAGNNNGNSGLGILTAGNNPPGIVGQNFAGDVVGTTFDDDAARSIRNGAVPYAAHYRPELTPLSAFDGLVPSNRTAPGEAFIFGTWTLRVIDNRNDGAAVVQGVAAWSLNFTSGLTTGADTLITSDPLGRPDGPPSAFTGPFTPTLAQPDRGVAPMPKVAFDNSLGSFSSFQSRAYLTYVQVPLQNNAPVMNNTNIMLAVSDDGGVNWGTPVQVNDDGNAFDDFSEGTRAQFSPSVAVDTSTGTLVLAWYDARHDAANARVTTYIGLSIDGGFSFAPQTFVNRTSTAQDAITFDPVTGTNTVVTLEPIPDNQSLGNGNKEANFSFGDHQGLAVANGRLYPIWSSNENNSGAVGATQTANNNNLVIRTVPGGVPFGAGPRVIASTMGSVATPNNQTLQTTVITDLTDPQSGTRLADRFNLVFDRPIDTGSISPTDLTVLFRSPNMQASVPGIPLRVLSVLPVPLRARSLTSAPFSPFNRLATLVTNLPHNLVPGDLITITGANEPDFNGTFAVSVIDEFTVQFLVSVNAPPVATGPIAIIAFVGPTGVPRTQYFEVRFDPSTRSDGTPYVGTHTGTYSYAVGPDVTDRMRSLTPSFVGGTVTTFNAVAPDVPLPLPTAGLGGSGTPDDFTTSTITVTGIAQPITDLNLRLSTDYPFSGDLEITLIGPDGLTSTILASFLPVFAGGATFYLNTTFDDQAPVPIVGNPGPFGLVQPQNPLSIFNGLNANGVWTLIIEDAFAADVGTLFSWGLDITTGGTLLPVTLGNRMDQDADSVRGEGNQDVYAVPRSTNGVPFSLPYDPTTLPLIVPGPHVVSTVVPLTVSIQSLFQIPHNPADGLGTATVTTATPHGLSNGDLVRISGAVNLTLPVTVASLTQTGGLATLTTATPHGLATGNTLTIAGANEGGYNGTFTINVTSPTTFTYNVPGGTPSPATGTGTITLQNAGANYNGTFGITVTGPTTFTYNVPSGSPAQAPGTLELRRISGPTDNLVLNSTNNAINVVFDRDMNPATFEADGRDVLEIVGPTGALPLTAPVTSLTRTGTVATLTTATAHGLSNGDRVAVGGAADLPLALVVQSLLHVGGLATLTTTTPHGLATNDSITISGANQPGYNNTFTITVTSPTTFTFSVPIGTPSPATGLSNITLVKDTDVENYNGVKVVTVTGPTTFTFAIADTSTTPATATGPLTLSLVTVAPDPDATTDPDPTRPRTFRVTFPRQFLPGSYAIKLGPNIQAKNGELLDSNQNAGLAVLRGTDPTTNFETLNVGVLSLTQFGGTATLTMAGPHGVATGAQVRIAGANQPGYNGVFTVTVTSPTTMQFRVPNGTPATATGTIVVSATPLKTITHNATGLQTNVTVGPGRSVASTITFDEAFALQAATLTMTVTHPDTRDLVIHLEAPDGARILLANGAGGRAGTPLNDFIDTSFDDFSTTPISSGIPPFTGTFSPQQPLAPLLNKASQGDWKLVVTNNSSTASATIVRWTLSLKQLVAGTGLGEAVADQESLNFRIFTMDAANPLAHEVWTAVGPASISQASVGRIGGLAVDPSDPTGNTVFVAGASGGIWKTTNFLTTNPNGPTYIPLTNFGPTFAINIGSLAVVGRNNDSNQTMVFASTGEGDTLSTGVGFLQSLDGGKTWTLLDSTKNVYEAGDLPAGDPRIGTSLPINSPLRDHRFVGTTSFKVMVDPVPLPNGEYVVYGALSGGNGGIWISQDTGKTWGLKVGNNRVAHRAGQATDIAFSAFSAFDPINPSAPQGNVRRVFAAFRGDGVYQSSDFGVSWQLLTGTVGNPLIRNYDETKNPPTTPIQVTGPSATPNGAKGRIVLATPSLSGVTASTNRITDLGLQGWLYALVSTPAGFTDGLYVTKDFGQNWTKVRIPQAPSPGLGAPSGIPSNDESRGDYDILGTTLSGQGNYNITLTVDPLNPNIVYLGGMPGPFKMIRVDTTGLSDPHAIVGFSHSDPDGGTLQTASTGPATVQPVTGAITPGTYAGVAVPQPPFLGFPAAFLTPTPYLNVLRDPTNPFAANATVLTLNIGLPNGRFNNEGTEANWLPFDAFIGGADLHEVVAMIDPLTGHTRLIIGNDHGVFTGIDLGGGRLLQSVGSVTNPSVVGGDVQFVTGTRNGNIQVTQFYYGAAQPSPLAAQIAGAMFYGHAQDDGFPQSVPNVIETGTISWAGPGFGDGTGVATDPTGSGTVYSFRWPCCGAGPDVTDFFLVNVPVASGGTGTYVSRTNGLVQQSNPGTVPDPQWPNLGGFNFAVNPVNGNELLIGSGAGRLFRTRDQGLNWVQKGFIGGDNGANANNTFDGSTIPALAFGARDPSNPLPDTDQFFYAGTNGGSIYVTFDGGATFKRFAPGTSGLSGSIQAISPSPRRGSFEAYAVTTNGVFWIGNSKTDTTWTRLNDTAGQGALLTLRTDFTLHNFVGLEHDPAVGDNSVEFTEQYLTSLVADWRDVIPDDPNNPGGPSHPTLYVGGEAGVFRSLDKGITWTIFPNVADDGAPVDGGFLPNAHITDLDLSAGNIDPNTGLPRQDLGYNLLVATTYGRGTFAIRLPTDIVDPNTGLPVNPFHGPRVVDFTPDIPQNPMAPSSGLHTITVTFATAVDPATFTVADLKLIGPDGPITALTLTDLTIPAPGQPNLHNVWQITFPNQTKYGDYTLTVGKDITDYSGRPMDQDNDFINGEANDAFVHVFKVAGLKVESVEAAILNTPRTEPVRPTPGLTDLIVTFNTAVNPASFNPDAPENDIVLLAPDGTRITPVSRTDITPLDADGNNQHNVWRLSFAQQLKPGTYTVTVGQNISDTFGFAMDQDQDQTFGESGIFTPGGNGDQFQDTIQVEGLFVLDAEPDPDEPNLLRLMTGTSSITLEFNREVDPTTFDTTDLKLFGPGGVDISNTLIRVVEPTTTNVEHNVWRVDFASPTEPGVYRLVVGPDIRDTSGTMMDQDKDLLNFGETGDQFATPPGDQYTVLYVVDGLAVSNIRDQSGQPIDSTNSLPRPHGTSFLDIVFNTELDASSFNFNDDIKLTGPTGPVTLTGLSLAPGPNPLGKIWRLTFNPLTVYGTYTLEVGANVLDLAGNQMNQNLNNAFGEPGFWDEVLPNPTGDVFRRTFQIDGLRVISPTSPTPTPNTPIIPSPSGLSSITLQFNMTVDPTSFDVNDLMLVGPGGRIIPIDPAPNVGLKDLTLGGTNLHNLWLVSFTDQIEPGVYTLTVGPNVQDMLGNKMDQDLDRSFGEATQDQFVVNYTVIGLRVLSIAPASPVVPGPLTFIDITFNTEVGSDFTAAQDLALTYEDGTPVTVSDPVDVTPAGSMPRSVWRVAVTTTKLAGVFSLTVGPNILDRAGNPMNQDGDTNFGELFPAPEDRFFGAVVLKGLRVEEMTVNGAGDAALPLPVAPGLQSITLKFNQTVRPGTFDTADVTLLDPRGNAVPGLVLEDLANGTSAFDIWELRFNAQTTPGVYRLTVGPNIFDLADRDGTGNVIAGNRMNQDLDNQFGEDPQDRFTFNYVVEGLRVQKVEPETPVTVANGLPAITITFNTEVGSDFDTGDVQITRPDGTPVVLAGAPVDVTPAGVVRRSVWRVDFPTEQMAGVYQVAIGPQIKDVAGNFMNQNQNTVYGELLPTPPPDRFFGTVVVAGLQVVSYEPNTSLTRLPGLSEIFVTFNTSVRPGTFSSGDVTLVAPDGTAITGLAVSDATLPGALPRTRFRIGFAERIQPGEYVLTVGPDIRDMANQAPDGRAITGNPMNQNGNAQYGETPADAFRVSIFIEGLRVESATPNATISVIGTSFVDVIFNTTVGLRPDGTRLRPDDVTLTGPEGGVPITGVADLTVNGSNRHNVWRVFFPTQQTVGTYTLTVGPNVLDTSGNKMDQNHDRTFGNPTADVFRTAFNVVPQVLASGPAVFDIGSLISILPGRARRRKGKPNRWLIPLRIFNASKATILGPFAIAIDGLGRRGRLVSSNGRTIFVPSLGRALQASILTIDQLGAFEGLDVMLEIQTRGVTRRPPQFAMQLLVGGPF